MLQGLIFQRPVSYLVTHLTSCYNVDEAAWVVVGFSLAAGILAWVVGFSWVCGVQPPKASFTKQFYNTQLSCDLPGMLLYS